MKKIDDDDYHKLVVNQQTKKMICFGQDEIRKK